MAQSRGPRKMLRQLLSTPGIIMAPGAYDCLTARIIEGSGISCGIYDRCGDLRRPPWLSGLGLGYYDRNGG